MVNPIPPGEVVTLRELYQLIEKVKDELAARITLIESQLESKLELHKSDHTRDQDHRSSLTRWAVTTTISAGSALFAIWLAVRR